MFMKVCGGFMIFRECGVLTFSAFSCKLAGKDHEVQKDLRDISIRVQKDLKGIREHLPKDLRDISIRFQKDLKGI